MESRCCQRKRGRGRNRNRLLGRDVTRQNTSDAVLEWITRGEDTDGSAAVCENLRHVALKGSDPWERGAADQRCRKLQVPAAAKHDRR